MLTLLVAAAALADAGPWFGPATVTYPVQFAGNPYDPATNDLRVVFLDDKNRAIERLAWFDPEIGAYRATLVAPRAGEYTTVLVRNGKQVQQESVETKVVLDTQLPKGYLRLDPVHRNRFRWDDGAPYFPFGVNLPWKADAGHTTAEGLSKLAAAGLNWSRVWATRWDGKNPWWPIPGEPPIAGHLWAPALAEWQAVIDGAEAARIPIQVALFHGGAFSTQVGQMPQHPWLAAQGGFLAKASDFFVDPEAKRRTKIWLRYAVARWAHSPSILAWELFANVEMTDAARAGRWGDIVTWHSEMAEYLRGIDPARHPVTSSASPDALAPAGLDFLLASAPETDVANLVPPTDKPFFFAEFGLEQGSDLRADLRDGVFASFVANQLGAAQFWPWEAVERDNLYGDFKMLSQALALSGLASRPNARALSLRSSPNARVMGVGEAGMAMVRLRSAFGPVEIGGWPFADGDHKAYEVDLDGGKTTEFVLTTRAFALSGFVPAGRDVILIVLPTS